MPETIDNTRNGVVARNLGWLGGGGGEDLWGSVGFRFWQYDSSLIAAPKIVSPKSEGVHGVLAADVAKHVCNYYYLHFKYYFSIFCMIATWSDFILLRL